MGQGLREMCESWNMFVIKDTQFSSPALSIEGYMCGTGGDVSKTALRSRFKPDTFSLMQTSIGLALLIGHGCDNQAITEALPTWEGQGLKVFHGLSPVQTKSNALTTFRG